MSDYSDIYLTPREAAEFLRTSTSTLAKLRLNGDGPKYCRIGRAIRYLKSDLDEYMARSRVRSTSEYVNGGDRHE
jgi:excisionase family DNA binding protein